MVTGLKDGSSGTEKIALRAELRISLAVLITVSWCNDGPSAVISKDNGHTVIEDLENVSWAEASGHLDDGSLSGVQDKDLISVCVLRTVGDSVPTGISHHRHEGSVNAEEGGGAIVTEAIIVHQRVFKGIGVDIRGDIVLGHVIGHILVLAKSQLGEDSQQDSLLEHILDR